MKINAILGSAAVTAKLCKKEENFLNNLIFIRLFSHGSLVRIPWCHYLKMGVPPYASVSNARGFNETTKTHPHDDVQTAKKPPLELR